LLLRNIMPGDVNVTNIISFRNLKAMGALLSAKPRDDCLYPGSDRLPRSGGSKYPGELNYCPESLKLTGIAALVSHARWPW